MLNIEGLRHGKYMSCVEHTIGSVVYRVRHVMNYTSSSKYSDTGDGAMPVSIVCPVTVITGIGALLHVLGSFSALFGLFSLAT